MNREISLHTIALYNGTEYELENLLNSLLYKIDQLEQELQRKDNEIKQLQEDIKNHIKIAGEYKEQMIIKDNIINELNQNKRDYERENILEMKLHILDNNWNELKRYIKESDDCWDIDSILFMMEKLENGDK